MKKLRAANLSFTNYRLSFFLSLLLLATTAVAQNVYLSTKTVKIEGNTRTPFVGTSLLSGVKRLDFSADNKRMTVNEEQEISLDSVTFISFKDDGYAFKDIVSAEMLNAYRFDIPQKDIANVTAMTSENVDPANEDFVENSEFPTKIRIEFHRNSVQVTKELASSSIETQGAFVTINSQDAGVEYEVTGETQNGGLKIYSDKKFKLTLNNAKITNPQGAAINIQSKKRAYIVLPEGTVSRLEDGENYTAKTAGEDEKGCLFSEGKLCFSGKGALYVTSNHKHAIVSDADIHVTDGRLQLLVNKTADNKATALKAKDKITIGGGYTFATTNAIAGKGLSCGGLMNITGGEVYAFTTGGTFLETETVVEKGETKEIEDYSSCSAIKCDSILTISDGKVGAQSIGEGGKGINAAYDLILSNADVLVKTFGKRIPEFKEGNDDTSASASPKGLKAGRDIAITNANIHFNTIGGDGAEGMEAKRNVLINSGNLYGFCGDDVINSLGGTTIKDGHIEGVSLANDGIDAAYIYHDGGYTYIIGSNNINTSFDTNNGNLFYRGGTMLGVAGTPCSLSSKSILCGVTAHIYDNYRTVALHDAEGKELVKMDIPPYYPKHQKFKCNYGVIICSPVLEQGKSYSIVADGATKLYDFTLQDKRIELKK